MSTETLGEPLPTLYAKWAAEFLGGPVPRESLATCDTCAMCPTGAVQESPSRSYFFNPITKCCTYVPDLHNFLVGRVLEESNPAAQIGRSTVEKRIAEGIGVTPLGLWQSPVYSHFYKHSDDTFGRSKALRCPHYLEEGDRCGVWRNRNSICSTWFCKHVRGSVGYAFWRSLQDALQIVERNLGRWCVLEVPLGDDALGHLMTTTSWRGDAGEVTDDSLNNKVNQESYDRIWGAWRGREREFFGRCGELVACLSWKDVLAISGPDLRASVHRVQQFYRRLTSNEIPPELEVGEFHVLGMQHGTTQVFTYSYYDPLDIPNALMEALPYFDGRPTGDAVAAIAEERGVQLESSLVLKMVDFGLLVPVEKKPRERQSNP